MSVKSAGSGSSSTAKSTPASTSSATGNKASATTTKATTPTSTATRSGNPTADRLDVQFKPEKETSHGVNLAAWGDETPTADTGKAEAPTAADQSAKLREALGDGTLRKNMEGDNVKALQEALNQRLGLKEGDDGYLTADGKYGPKTQSAVRDFQKQNEGLQQDGVFGPKTRDALLAGGQQGDPVTGDPQTPPADQGATEKKPETPVDPATGQPTPTEPGANDPKAETPEQAAERARLEQALGTSVMRKDMQGDNVKALQEALNSQLGRKEGDENYLELDGKFGKGTLAAVQEFQRSKKLSDDGIVGQDTRDALLGKEIDSSKQVEQGSEAGPASERYEKYTQHRELLARAIAAEARGEGYDTQVAVAQTIMNYANAKGKGLTSLVGNRNSAFLSSNQDGNKKFYTMSTSNIPNWERTLKAVDDALAGKSAVGADRIYFHDDSIGPPRWVDRNTQLALGRMRFYEEK